MIAGVRFMLSLFLAGGISTSRQVFTGAFTATSAAMTTKTVLVPIADDSEEIETTCITDTLARCGASVTVASVKPDGALACEMSRGIQFPADATLEEAASRDFDAVVSPGGMPGARHLRECAALARRLQKQREAHQR